MKEKSYTYKSANYVANLNKMRLSGKFCDVVIKTKNKEFPAHKVILATNLKYFRSRFRNVGEDTEHNGIILMNDVEESYLETLILFAYTGQILLTKSNVLGLLCIAIYLHEDEVEEACTEFLTDFLKVKNACRVYAFANAIGCRSLKNTTRYFISSLFENCSQTRQFLELDCESIKHILCETILAFPAGNKMLFEGLIRWILHDVISRRNCLNDLLEVIEIAKLNKKYLSEYDYKNIENHGFIIQDVMSFYCKQIEQKNYESSQESGLSLILIGNIRETLHAQIWNHLDKKWSTPHKIIQPDGCDMALGSGIVFDNIFYNLVIDQSSHDNIKIYLAKLDISSMQNRMLISDSRLIWDSAMCASLQSIFLCGGRTKDDSVSDQVLQYDPKTNVLKTLPPLTTKRCRATAIFYRGRLYVLGGIDESAQLLDSVERYNPATEEWSTLVSVNTPYDSFGVAVLDNKLYIGGGIGHSGNRKAVEFFKKLKIGLQPVNSMKKGRLKFHMVAYAGKLLACGGDEKNTIEVYDPNENQWKTNNQLSTGLQIKYPKGGLIAFNRRRKRTQKSEEVERECKRPKLEN